MKYEESHSAIRDRGIKRLSKLAPIYVHYSSDRQPGTTLYYCFYVEKNVVKYAIISDKFWVRYGPNVLATLKNSSPTALWQMAKNTINDGVYEIMCELYDNGSLNIEELVIEDLEYES